MISKRLKARRERAEQRHIKALKIASLRNYTDTEIAELAHDLRGTCQSLEEARRKLSTGNDKEMTTVDCQALDDLVVECAECSWWCEPGEMQTLSEGEMCQDCAS